MVDEIRPRRHGELLHLGGNLRIEEDRPAVGLLQVADVARAHDATGRRRAVDRLATDRDDATHVALEAELPLGIDAAVDERAQVAVRLRERAGTALDSPDLHVGAEALARDRHLLEIDEPGARCDVDRRGYGRTCRDGCRVSESGRGDNNNKRTNADARKSPRHGAPPFKQIPMERTPSSRNDKRDLCARQRAHAEYDARGAFEVPSSSTEEVPGL